MVTGRWVAIALTASLAVNVFLAGMFAGRQMGGPPSLALMRTAPPHEQWHPGDGGLPPFVDRIASGMAPQYRTIFLSTMSQHQADIATRGVALRQVRAKLREMVSADTFDRAAAAAALADLRQRSLEFQETLQSALLDAAAQLPVDARRQMMNPHHGPDDR